MVVKIVPGLYIVDTIVDMMTSKNEVENLENSIVWNNAKDRKLEQIIGLSLSDLCLVPRPWRSTWFEKLMNGLLIH